MPVSVWIISVTAARAAAARLGRAAVPTATHRPPASADTEATTGRPMSVVRSRSVVVRSRWSSHQCNLGCWRSIRSRGSGPAGRPPCHHKATASRSMHSQSAVRVAASPVTPAAQPEEVASVTRGSSSAAAQSRNTVCAGTGTVPPVTRSRASTMANPSCRGRVARAGRWRWARLARSSIASAPVEIIAC